MSRPSFCGDQEATLAVDLVTIQDLKGSVMWLKNPLADALCKTRQENAEAAAYRQFAEKLCSRIEATPIDQGHGIIDLFGNRGEIAFTIAIRVAKKSFFLSGHGNELERSSQRWTYVKKSPTK
jgi:hypothetical protein